MSIFHPLYYVNATHHSMSPSDSASYLDPHLMWATVRLKIYCTAHLLHPRRTHRHPVQIDHSHIHGHLVESCTALAIGERSTTRAVEPPPEIATISCIFIAGLCNHV